MWAISIAPTFRTAVSQEDDGEGKAEDTSTWLSQWKYKRKRNGLKGRTPKHPLNKRPYTC
jgi:hypothetical protein